MANYGRGRLQALVSVTKALSDGNRVRILMSLRKGELCVCQIVELLGLAPSTVSKHLAILQQAGLADSRKNGRWVYYRLPGDEAPRYVTDVLQWLQTSLQEDSMVAQDEVKRSVIIEQELSDLCQRYKN